jgi:ATP-dependent DNA helicase RecQ
MYPSSNSSQKTIQDAKKILKGVFGYPDFREGQQRVIQSILDGQDTLAIMPTGQGKSLCYQIPALMLDGLSLVISPLIALMKDQVDHLKALNYPARALNSQSSSYEKEITARQIKDKSLKLLFVAPERLESEGFRDLLRSTTLALLAIDEAHCISEWGHDFRPTYRDIITHLSPLMKESMPVKLALTATATKEVVSDIRTSLKLQKPRVYIGGFDRKNLSFSVFDLENKRKKLLQILKVVAGPAIIYTSSRQRAEELEGFLDQHRVLAKAYHAGLSDQARSAIQSAFFQDRFRVICSTNAFGMGINKPDVRVVIHYDLPDNIEAYYQEAGRAGRDGRKSYAVLLYTPSDIKRQEYILEHMYPNKEEVFRAYQALRFFKPGSGFWISFTLQEWLDKLDQHQTKPFSLFKLQSVLDLLVRQELVTVHPDAKSKQWRIRVLVERGILKEWINASGGAQHKKLFDGLLRQFGDSCFYHYKAFNLEVLTEKSGLGSDDIKPLLRLWLQHRLIDLKESDMIDLKLNSGMIPIEKLPIDWGKIERRKQVVYDKFKQVKRYIAYTKCRRNFILDYFGETHYSEKCGICDNCTGRHRS